jgi:hypothetical protein
MQRGFSDPTPQEQAIVLIDRETIHNAGGFIKSCEHCNPEDADWPFNVVLDRLTGSDPRVDGLHSGRASEVSKLQTRYSRKDSD